jgi:hypothetical protein
VLSRHRLCTPGLDMRYRSISGLPKERAKHYSRYQKFAFLKAFGPVGAEDSDEIRALRTLPRRDSRAKSRRRGAPMATMREGQPS